MYWIRGHPLCSLALCLSVITTLIFVAGNKLACSAGPRNQNKTTHPPLFFTAFQNRSFILITAFGRGLPIRSVSSYRTFLLSTSCHRYRSCQLAKRTDPILSSKLDSVTAKGVYASSDQSNIMRSRRSIQSPISKRRETNFQSSLLRSDSQGKHCHHIGLSFFQHHVTDIGLVS